MQKSFLKTFIFNTIGVVLALIGALIVYNLTYFIFEWLGQFSIITRLLSWPVDYSEYALTAIFLSDIFVSACICKFFCEMSKARYNYGIVVLFIINLARYIYGCVQNITYLGFSFSLLVVYLFAFGALIATLGMVPNEKVE